MLQMPALNLGAGQYIAAVLVADHQLGKGFPLFGSFLVHDQVVRRHDAFIAVVGTDLQPTGLDLIQNLHHHAVENFVFHSVFPGGSGEQGQNSGVDNCFHRKAPHFM